MQYVGKQQTKKFTPQKISKEVTIALNLLYFIKRAKNLMKPYNYCLQYCNLILENGRVKTKR